MTIKILFYIIFSIFPLFSYCQKNSIRIDLRNILEYSNKEIDVKTPPSLLLPSTRNIRSVDFSIYYNRKLKNINLLGGLGFSSSLVSSLEEIETTDNIQLNESERLLRGFHLHFGVSKFFELSSSKLFSIVDFSISVEKNYFDNHFFGKKIFDLNNNYLGMQELNIEYNENIILGPDFMVGLYYKIYWKLFIGVKVRSWFFLNIENGDVITTANEYDEHNNIISNQMRTVNVKSTLFSDSHGISFSVMKLF